MEQELEGRTALITGGTSGIGRATAARLLAGGARVAITGRTDERLRRAAAALGHEDRLTTVVADVTDRAAHAVVAERLAERFGGLDVVFANAGDSAFGPIATIGEADVDRVVDANLKGVYWTVQAVEPLMPDGASIVLNASWTVHRGLPGAVLYSATKAAVLGMTAALAAELAPRRIRVNAVSPGYIRTEMFETAVTTSEQLAGVEASIVLGRVGAAEEVAEAVAFLASERASYVNGHDLVVDGGLLAA
jgi:NAD(P)-dependent dehydrogenase (short-subunit alcohol dehydrogenase family)